MTALFKIPTVVTNHEFGLCSILADDCRVAADSGGGTAVLSAGACPTSRQTEHPAKALLSV